MSDSESYWEITWRQLRRKKFAMGGLYFVVFLLFLATYASWIAMNKPIWVTGPDGITSPLIVSFFDRHVFPSGIDTVFNLLSFFLLPLTLLTMVYRRAWKWIWGVGGVVYGLGLLACFLPATWLPDGWSLNYSQKVSDGILEYWGDETAVFPPIPFGLEPNETKDSKKAPGTVATRVEGMTGPDRHFLLGTDGDCKDVATMLLYGTRISLTIGVVAVGIYVTLGTILGAVAGYFGGWVDSLISRLIEIMISIPPLILIIAIVGILESRNIFNVMVVIGVTSWPRVARLVRAEFLRLRELDFVLGARSLGAAPSRIIFRHVLPNAVGPILVAAALGVPAAILVESGLSFLGLGDTSSPSWGQILQSGRTSGLLFWLIHPPGLAIFLTVSAMNLLGDGVRDALDPKLRGR